MSIGVCLKWVDQRPELSGTGVGEPDGRFAGLSAADRAALELALRMRERSGEDVVAVTLGPAPASAVLREALAVGATRVVHVHAPAAMDSDAVAAALAPELVECRLVLCGDYSLDRGTGSVPAFLAAVLGTAQALGLVEVAFDALTAPDTAPDTAAIGALRRLDGGRRERLEITLPAVISVEGSVAELRRAGLAASLAATRAVIPTSHPAQAATPERHRIQRPYRPRARVLLPPSGSTALERIVALTDASGESAHGETVVLTPSEAAHRLLATLTDWGYV